MTAPTLPLDRAAHDAAAKDQSSAKQAVKLSEIADDQDMIRLAAKLARDLSKASPKVYWTDFLASTVIGYAGLAAAIFAGSTAIAVIGGVIAVLALYRAGSFIHELTHLKRDAVPGFRTVWNALIGVPLLVPSFMYIEVHNLHHNKTRYGTVRDPEYLPLARMKPWSVPLFVVVAALAPIALLFRYAVLTPLSFLIPPLRTLVVERYSALAINPDFRRRMPEGRFAREWTTEEAAASIWAIALIALTATGIIPLKAFAIFLGIMSASIVLNQIRTLVAHLWENEGEAMSVTAQYLDSVNVPPPGLLPELWAPVGLRYHALHHLLPSVPYHALGEAHRRLIEALPQTSQYHGANYKGLPGLVSRLVRNTFRA
ncbi:fatty acid desaturase family protein [Alterisphingorhabdus coralli]|uniref:Fatty acid desaturase n=1 Tax=Alterisphingorhabdus coralli TaxID=3071408 RepID=A0AA97F9U6_9SPHN|nr:fatty acid desaturase [Parasphingorhabdus sp. SCSIO 66989]WOE75702.1 fatty acid desaturase [Parasphingorhabdus sp. SCSIO 66989]